MNAFTLKMIAVITMLIDHVGLLFFPDVIFFRLIGRISLPIFAFLLVEGYFHTKNLKKYIGRLLFFGVISEIPFDLALFGKPFEWGRQNVMFMLCIGLIMMHFLNRWKSLVPRLATVIGTMGFCMLLNTDYRVLGILLIAWMYFFHGFQKELGIGILCIFLAWKRGSQILGALSLVPMLLYNGQQGPKVKWAIGMFYPVHLLGLYLLSLVI